MQQCRKRVLQSLQETGSIVGQAERQGAAAPPGTILQSSQEALAAAEDLLHSLREIRLEETHVQRCQHTLEAHRAQQNDHQGTSEMQFFFQTSYGVLNCRLYAKLICSLSNA